MPSYKLTYFDLTALGEPIRLLFHYGKIPFTDNRIQRPDWPALKPTMPFGVMPVLEVDGKRLHQSMAIARYVGNLVNLAGNDAWENAQIDAAADTINDLRLKLNPFLFEADATKKANLKKTVDEDILPFFLSKLDAQAKANNGYLANGKLSWADFFYAGLYEFINFVMGTNVFSQYPNLEQVYKNILSFPHVKAYVDKRPKDKPIPPKKL